MTLSMQAVALGCLESLLHFVEFNFRDIYCWQKPSDWHLNIKHWISLGPSVNRVGIRTNKINAQMAVKSD